MGIIIKGLKNLFILLVYSLLFFKPLYSKNEQLNNAKQEFLLGNYEKSITIASNLNTIESKIFQSRAMSVYAHFFLEEDAAKQMFFESYELAKEAYLSNINNAEAYVEAAHALGRYGQKIGIMSAITEGIADRVKRYLDKAITIDPENIIANLSKGIWHSEIINQAGKTLAKAVYGADASKARIHFTKVYKINNKEISILYELAYGYYLLGKDEDLRLSKRYIEELLSLKEVAHIDTIYKKQALILKDLISK